MYLINIIYMILIVAPFSILRYYPFKKSLRIKPSKLIIIYSILLITQILGFLFIVENKISINKSIEDIYIIIWSIIYYLLSCLVINERLSKHTSVYLLVGVIYYGGVMGISNYVYSLLKIVYGIDISYIVVNIFIKLVSILSFPIYIIFTKKIIVPMLKNIEDKIWDIIVVIFIVLLASSRKEQYNIPYLEIYTKNYLEERLLVITVTVVIIAILLNNLSKNIENTQLKNQLEVVDKVMDIQQKEYERLEKRNMKTRKMRHNNRQHFNAMKSYIYTKDKDGLFDYVSGFPGNIIEHDEIYCNNNTINLILGYYIKVAKLDNIESYVDIMYSKGADYQLLHLNKVDLWVLFGNIFENAIEACNAIESNDKFIKIKIMLNENILSMIVDNSYNGMIKQDSNGKLYSLKNDGRVGIGIDTIKAITDKYNGSSRFIYDKSMFSTSIILMNQSNAKDLYENQ